MTASKVYTIHIVTISRLSYQVYHIAIDTNDKMSALTRDKIMLSLSCPLDNQKADNKVGCL